ncbi:MAG TPA: FGGY-family carbohydrate kinase, partial [Bauldia sp.]|nr:FGGY-family carbohydrate kinase [Bauldia sp.]
AVMEGVAYNIRQCVDLFVSIGGQIDEVRIAEGGARVPRWCQIIADVVGRPVSVLAEFDASALGAAMLAASGTTGEPLPAVASRTVRLGTRIQPDPLRGRAYDEGFRRFCAIAGREVVDRQDH